MRKLSKDDIHVNMNRNVNLNGNSNLNGIYSKSQQRFLTRFYSTHGKSKSFLTILILFLAISIIVLLLTPQFQIPQNELIEMYEREITLEKAQLGPFKQIEIKEKSKIPIIYYYSGKLPKYGLVNIENTLRFHENVYFVSKDIKVDIPDVKNVNDSNFQLPISIQNKMKNSTNKHINTVHVSDFRRIALFDLFPQEDYIYSDLDEIILRPIHRCNFVTLSWVSYFFFFVNKEKKKRQQRQYKSNNKQTQTNRMVRIRK
jgi:hypothetical protein